MLDMHQLSVMMNLFRILRNIINVACLGSNKSHLYWWVPKAQTLHLPLLLMMMPASPRSFHLYKSKLCLNFLFYPIQCSLSPGGGTVTTNMADVRCDMLISAMFNNGYLSID